MAKAKVLKIPARGDWEFAEVETEADGNIPLEAMQSLWNRISARIVAFGL